MMRSRYSLKARNGSRTADTKSLTFIKVLRTLIRRSELHLTFPPPLPDNSPTQRTGHNVPSEMILANLKP